MLIKYTAPYTHHILISQLPINVFMISPQVVLIFLKPSLLLETQTDGEVVICEGGWRLARVSMLVIRGRVLLSGN